MGWNDEGVKALVGKDIARVQMNSDFLILTSSEGETFTFSVEGDCCSWSYFYDFYGIDKLINNGPVVSASSLSLDDPDDENSQKGECVAAYGFELVTEHPIWGEQTSVLSFRNDSNGYYGGWMNGPSDHPSGDVEDVSDREWVVVS